jgi:hypothetical protein
LETIMRNKMIVITLCLASVVCATGPQTKAYGQSVSNQIPKEVSALAGTFTGAWAIFGVDEKGQPVKRMAWTDTIRADAPAIKGDRAFVTTTDEMVFEGGKIPPMKIKGTEGYFLNKDGSLGDYFIEVFGQLYRVRKIEKNVWTYTMMASPQELAELGFAKAASGQHVVVKVITQEQGAETHRITRLTTANWKDAEGKERWIQYVSLQGFHRRQ